MARPLKNGCYIAAAVAAYLDENTVEQVPGGTGRDAAQIARHINGRRATSSHLRQISKWRNRTEKLTSLRVVDEMFVYYGLSLPEFETWAEDRYGNHTFFDSSKLLASICYDDPKEVAA